MLARKILMLWSFVGLTVPMLHQALAVVRSKSSNAQEDDERKEHARKQVEPLH